METSIDYSVRVCSLGRLLVAGTSRGVCFVRFGASEDELRRRLEREFPYAACREVSGGRLGGWSQAVESYVDADTETIDVPLDVRGSAFQRRVWRALRRIPRGETRAYSAIARAVGSPRGARAVARACATNPVAVVTPCHRVVERGGGLGGYAGGLARKRALLRTEGVALEPDTGPRSAACSPQGMRVDGDLVDDSFGGEVAFEDTILPAASSRGASQARFAGRSEWPRVRVRCR